MKYNSKLVLILIITRFIDLISTYVVTPNLQIESSPLTRMLNFKWTGLILINIIVILVFTFFLNYFNIRKIEIIEKNFNSPIFIKNYYKNILIKNYGANIFKLKFNNNIFFYFFFISLIISFSIISLLASMNNFFLYFYEYSPFDKLDSSQVTNFLFLLTTLLLILIFHLKIKSRITLINK